jgi:hypothetical protein
MMFGTIGTAINGVAGDPNAVTTGIIVGVVSWVAVILMPVNPYFSSFIVGKSKTSRMLSCSVKSMVKRIDAEADATGWRHAIDLRASKNVFNPFRWPHHRLGPWRQAALRSVPSGRRGC